MYKDSHALYKDNPFPGKLMKYLDTRNKLSSRLLLSMSQLTLFGEQNVTRLRNYYLRDLQLPPKLIIDIGCGTGETTNIIGKAFPDAKIIGFDLSNGSIEYAKKLTQYMDVKNVSFINRNINEDEDLNEINNADIIIMSGSLHHFYDPKKILEFLSSKIRTGGFIEIGVYGRMFESERNIKNIFEGLYSIKTKDQVMEAIQSLDLDRLNNVLNMKKENRFLRSIKSIFLLDLSYIGYVLFPHNTYAANFDGYAHPIVHYYNPETLVDLIEITPYSKIEHILPSTEYDKNPFYEQMNNYQKFLFCDAKLFVSMYTVKIWM